MEDSYNCATCPGLTGNYRCIHRLPSLSNGPFFSFENTVLEEVLGFLSDARVPGCGWFILMCNWILTKIPRRCQWSQRLLKEMCVTAVMCVTAELAWRVPLWALGSLRELCSVSEWSWPVVSFNVLIFFLTFNFEIIVESRANVRNNTEKVPRPPPPGNVLQNYSTILQSGNWPGYR